MALTGTYILCNNMCLKGAEEGAAPAPKAPLLFPGTARNLNGEVTALEENTDGY